MREGGKEEETVGDIQKKGRVEDGGKERKEGEDEDSGR